MFCLLLFFSTFLLFFIDACMRFNIKRKKSLNEREFMNELEQSLTHQLVTLVMLYWSIFKKIRQS